MFSIIFLSESLKPFVRWIILIPAFIWVGVTGFYLFLSLICAIFKTEVREKAENIIAWLWINSIVTSGVVGLLIDLTYVFYLLWSLISVRGK